MEMQVQAKGLPRAAQLRHDVSRRLTTVLARFAHGVVSVKVHLSDINGPQRGGVDKLCRAVIRLRNGSLLVVEELGSDLGRVIERVAERVQSNVARELHRLVNTRRRALLPA